MTSPKVTTCKQLRFQAVLWQISKSNLYLIQLYHLHLPKLYNEKQARSL